ncbi:phosphatase PAP2 family protein [Priestia taiwanensis]|uniref:PAP2 family phosphoesterase n=1 Tax=Priestia taiwanensis TaxID=1347902 RepID=A0A917END3_9BACI|nr:phosphatase PAP2 family protein [Priestia taiwanensis]MBM7362489.1 membrane-associated phospholipid phosphatase [Priestia taiwanensis]GGE62632.1 PAP2 family phosphoesterase [Priestia taiwanensis]
MMNFIKRYVIPSSLMLLFLSLSPLYDMLNKHNQEQAFHIMISLDATIPYIKEFIIPYLIWFPFLLICFFYFLLKDLRTYYITMVSVILGKLVCFLVYYFFQTTITRPVISDTDVFSSLVTYIYNLDDPFNCFPSIHVLTSAVMIIAIHQSSIKRITNILIIDTTAILIILSTIFVKQHAILDVVAGLLLSVIISATLARSINKSFHQDVVILDKQNVKAS